MAQDSSPTVSEAVLNAVVTSSSPINPAIRWPRATRAEPVSVATSMMQSGFSSLAATRPSASTTRPSASVLVTSTVLPPRMVITSLGRIAVPDGMFSAMHSQAVTAIGSLRSAIARVTAKTVAAPVMSYFMPTIEFAGLIDNPPVSNVMPLPTSAMCRFAPFGEYRTITSRGGRDEPAPIPRMPPYPPRSSACSS
ncbi:unannotated protein [freshwater metagenome]|uniref:Unannotated protein n=1 Tax=freshwater metagenome TaxID=449393 RepID=A0A6J6FQ29_9ZZZZ